MKDELFYEAESKTARPHKYSIKYKQDDVIYPTMVIRSQAETIELQEKEIDRLKGSLNTAIEDIFTLLRVINSNVKELKCSDEELEVINKYSYNPKGVEKK